MTYMTNPSRILPFLLTLVLLLSATVIPASASSSPKPVFDADMEDMQFTEWSFDQSSNTVTAQYPSLRGNPAKTVVYTPHELEGSPIWSRLYIAERDTVYFYTNQIHINEQAFTLHTVTFGGDVLFMIPSGESDDAPIPYFTDASARRIADLLEGTSSDYILRTPRGVGFRATTYAQDSETWDSLLDELQTLSASAQSSAKEVSLREFRFLKPTVIYRMGDPTWFSVPEYFIYEINGVQYVLPADTLKDSQFISGSINTTLSDRVTLYPVTESIHDRLQTLIDKAKTDVHTSTSEASEVFEDFESAQDNIFDGNGQVNEDDRNVAIVAVVFCCMLVPIAPIIVGLVKGLAGKKLNTRRWLWLTVAGGAWFVLGILLLLVLLV